MWKVRCNHARSSFNRSGSPSVGPSTNCTSDATAAIFFCVPATYSAGVSSAIFVRGTSCRMDA